MSKTPLGYLIMRGKITFLCFESISPTKEMSLETLCFPHSCLRASPLFANYRMVRWKQIEWTWNFANEEWLLSNSISRVRELRRLVFAESTERDMVLLSERLWRRLRFPSIARIPVIDVVMCSYACAFCGKNTVKRTCVGIWECKKCGKVLAGGAWSVATPAALTVRSSIQRLRRSKVEA